MSLIPKISAKLSEFKSKIHLTPKTAISQKTTRLQPFSNNSIQPHDALELTSDKFDEMNSQIQENIFEEEEKEQSAQLPRLSFLA